jgi:hypothetical protein
MLTISKITELKLLTYGIVNDSAEMRCRTLDFFNRVTFTQSCRLENVGPEFAKHSQAEKRINLDGNFRWNTISEGLRMAFTERGPRATHNDAYGSLLCPSLRTCRSPRFARPEGSCAIFELFICAQ